MNEPVKTPLAVENFIKSVELQIQKTIEKGRHRAAMLRQRASEIDADIDELEHGLKALPLAINNWVNFERRVDDDLTSLSLVEPRPVITGSDSGDEAVDVDSKIDAPEGGKLLADLGRLIGR